MFPLFKKKTTASEIGTALSSFIRTPKHPIPSSKDFPSINRDQVEDEMLFLRLFAVDIATQTSLRDSPVKDAVLKAYYEELRSIIRVINKDSSGFLMGTRVKV
jgi:hypothetical protein